MVDFDLREAHQSYQEIIVETFEDLSQIFPAAPLKRVLVYPPQFAKNTHSCPNRSLGDATEPGVIKLNGLWFGKPLGDLTEEGEVDDYVPGIPNLRWHGGLPQPAQVLIHEFFHILRDGLGKEAEEFSESLWMEATEDPSSAFTGYSMYNPSECWAECGAGYVLGQIKNPYVNRLGHFLE